MGNVSLNFDRKEFACECGCGLDVVDAELVQCDEIIRAEFRRRYPNRDIRFHITSGNRCEKHNSETPGASDTSFHVKCKANDFFLYDKADKEPELHKKWRVPEAEVYEFLDGTWPNGYGIGRYNGRNHLDVRVPCVRWDKRTKQ